MKLINIPDKELDEIENKVIEGFNALKEKLSEVITKTPQDSNDLEKK
tara:strand:+ start:1849 stop:1989 length:141 start_codon:yes stop_codon:yes gene_type:complete